ncbi:DUF2637 domain-containing protein [Pseudonocardia sp. ICBG1142]|uniref:DUF2637 domain-containing protein n=1 Tax=Pseudonocardia sp. ICBG1142 TaxID=2846760 RepID=UPI001CF609A5|nr:DUF2637 domain-containing protein [Pseudonocardia sp. ICBG1142]
MKPNRRSARIPRPSRRQLQVALSGAMLTVVVGAPAAASFHGLTQAGAGALGLTGGWEVLVPLVLDAGAAYTAVLAVRDVLAGDSAFLNRALTWLYALGGAGLNAWWGTTLNTAAALYFAAATLSAVVLWDRTLRAMRRDQLRERGAVQDPTPRFRLARWLVAPGETARAWREAVLENVTDPATAVDLARAKATAVETERLHGHIGRADDTSEHDSDETPNELEGMKKAAAIRHALTRLGPGADPKDVVAWLEERGVRTQTSYVYDVRNRDNEKAGNREIGSAEPHRQLHAAS